MYTHVVTFDFTSTLGVQPAVCGGRRGWSGGAAARGRRGGKGGRPVPGTRGTPTVQLLLPTPGRGRRPYARGNFTMRFPYIYIHYAILIYVTVWKELNDELAGR